MCCVLCVSVPTGQLQSQLAWHWTESIGDDATLGAEDLVALERAAVYKFLLGKNVSPRGKREIVDVCV